MTITVTAEDIRRGTRAACAYCPVARAIRRVAGRAPQVSVMPTGVWVRNRLYSLPKKAREFIFHFDHGSTVTPITFELPIPAK